MARVPGLRRPPKGKTFSTCQLVTQARIAGFTLGITTENIPSFSSARSVIGLDEPARATPRAARWKACGSRTARRRRRTRRRCRACAPGRYHGMVVSPLRTARLDPPDICPVLRQSGADDPVHQRPAMAQLPALRFNITGESACADSWGHALKTKEVQLSIPCYAERRYGAVADDEMLMACAAARSATRGDRVAGAVQGRAALSDHAVRPAGGTGGGDGEELWREVVVVSGPTIPHQRQILRHGQPATDRCRRLVQRDPRCDLAKCGTHRRVARTIRNSSPPVSPHRAPSPAARGWSTSRGGTAARRLAPG